MNNGKKRKLIIQITAIVLVALMVLSVLIPAIASNL